MSDKDLSKPVGFASQYNIDLMQRDKIPYGQLTIWRHGEVPVYSAEYVQHLLGRIESMAQAHIALQQLCEVYRSAYEEARGIVNIPMVEALEKAQRYIEELREWNAGLAQESCERQLRIAELEAIVNTPVAAEEYQRGYAEAMSSAASGVRQLYIQHTHHVGVDGLLNRCKELEQSFIQSEENHRGGLTVQDD